MRGSRIAGGPAVARLCLAVAVPDGPGHGRDKAMGGSVMSLSPREQHALDSIKEALAGSELAALLATFTRLVSGEEMPAREPAQARKQGHPRRAGKRRHPRQEKMRRRAHGVYRRLGFHRVALLLWLVITAALITTAVALDGSSRNGCPLVSISSAIQRSCAAYDAGLPAAPPAAH
jgi:hypothetical protein